MSITFRFKPLAVLLALFWAGHALADVAELQSEWAEIMYNVAPDQRENALASLADKARKEVAEHPNDAGC